MKETQKNPWTGLIALALILTAVVILVGMASKWLGPVVNNNGDVVAAAPIVSVDTNKASTTGTDTTKGIDQPSKSWFIAKKGSMISGDVAIFDNDNNSKKTPIYDNMENTADVIILGDTVYIWTEWGCHYWENPTQSDIDGAVSDRLSEGFATVRFFDDLTKTNYKTPTALYTAK